MINLYLSGVLLIGAILLCALWVEVAYDSAGRKYRDVSLCERRMRLWRLRSTDTRGLRHAR